MISVEKYGADRVFAVSYDYGQKQKAELHQAAKLCEQLGIGHKILNLGILGEIAEPILQTFQVHQLKFFPLKMY